MQVFATLGPEGSNHELVTRHYLAFHGLMGAEIKLIDDFEAGLSLMAEGKVDHIIQAAAHSGTAAILAKAHFHYQFRTIDCFIAPSHPLALLTRSDVEVPVTLALQPATRDYADLSRWPTLIEEATTVAVGQGLLAGRYDSGITMLQLAEDHPGRFRIEQALGTVDDAWIVYGRTRTCDGDILAWRDAPAGRLYRGE
jgi:hypothetical protein